MAVLFGVLGMASPGTAQGETPPPADPLYIDPAFDDPAYIDPAFDDPAYIDPAFDDPCDPAYHPDPASDPYCNPALTFDGSYDPALGDTVPDEFIDDGGYCDPEYYPDWESDPYCNPGVDNGGTVSLATSPTTTGSSDRAVTAMSNRGSEAYEAPLTDLDPDEAPAIGAGRMLLAIDAIAELGGFERAVTPEGAALLRDIRDTIPADGLDELGYTMELERFVTDFIPFLESLETEGVPVSDDLWNAARNLDDVVFGEVDPDRDDAELELMQPRRWITGLADLLVRGGVPAIPMAPGQDDDAIRQLLAEFAVAEPEPAPSTSTTEAQDDPPPTALALQTDPDPVPDETGTPIVPLAVGGAALLLGAGAVVAFRRRSPKHHDAAASSDATTTTPNHGSGQPDGATDDGEATSTTTSVTELLDASRRMSASLDPATIARIALSEAKRIVAAEGGIVVRRTENGLDPIGCEPPMLFNYDGIGQGCLPRVIETGQATAAIAHDDPLLIEVPMAMGAVPIVADGVITGAILVVRVSAKPFDRDELDTLEMLAPLVGSAFAVADEHGTAVDVEPLTGLQNRRRLDLDLASISAEDEVAYVMVDIDHFKNFNDTNGHAAGDEALRQVSALLQAAVRPKDLVYRYGGEEFCVLLPGATADEAAIVAERARAAVETAKIPGMENQPEGRVTISVGVSDSAFGTPSDLVERADAALYESKRNGRNRVTLHGA